MKLWKLSDFDYGLPKELIAQTPIVGRSGSRMLVLDDEGGHTAACKIEHGCKISHKKFSDFVDYLNAGDVLVLNDTKVIPARLLARRNITTHRNGGAGAGAAVEIFLLKPLEDAKWSALIKNSRRLKIGETIVISPRLSVKIIEKGVGEERESTVELIYDGDIYEILNEVGKIPLPPYISRSATLNDEEVYQTVFASNPGSVAAPTAGLHFTREILEKIEKKGVKIVYITLMVGLGTFLPVQSENIQEHKMHFESFIIPPETAAAINSARGNIVAVGTTVVRTLESTYQKHGAIIPTTDETNIFIYPPYEFKVVDKLLTNFHLPKSTLIMLVSAFSGKENILNAYGEAVREKYRFFSYGDCMLLNK